MSDEGKRYCYLCNKAYYDKDLHNHGCPTMIEYNKTREVIEEYAKV